MMDVPEDVESVMSEVWRYTQTYSLGSEEAEDRAPIWYVPDEVGAAVQHSDTPNVRLIPFVHLPDKITYSILFPLENIPCGTMLTRDYAEGPETDPDTRRALLLPWTPDTSFLNFPFQQEEAPESFFTEGRMTEIQSADIEANIDAVPRPIKVYSEYSEVSKSLKHPDFTLVSTPEEADILWLTEHHRDFASLGCNRFVNQFPYESVLTVKDLLCVVCRRSTRRSEGGLDGGPAWLPTTYNLKTELPQFVSCFERRHDREMDNHWICKPWNLARGLDTYVSQELNFILQLPWTGPKIAQKYIEDPVLFNRPEIGKVKFDVRYVILLKSVQPLEAYVYKEFFVRFANLPFQ
jgi:tubulin--tyrosine ligase-like protein 12